MEFEKIAYFWVVVVALRSFCLLLEIRGTLLGILFDIIAMVGFVVVLPIGFLNGETTFSLFGPYFAWLFWKALKKDYEIRETNKKEVSYSAVVKSTFVSFFDKVKHLYREHRFFFICSFIVASIVLVNSLSKSLNAKNNQEPAQPKEPTVYKSNEEDYSNKIPFAGMERKYINNTAVGTYTEQVRKQDVTYYYWCIGKFRVLKVTVRDFVYVDETPWLENRRTTRKYDIVTEVEQYFEDIAWTEETVSIPYVLAGRQYMYKRMYMPRFGPYYKGEAVTSSELEHYFENKMKNRKHNTHNYNNPDGYGNYDDFDDFYNDHYDDFDSIEEAEDYFDNYY